MIRELRKAGLDSIPGGGGEILVQRVRDIVAPKKAGADRWLEIMELAHNEGMKTSVTMMYGIGETLAERIEHLQRVRDVQSRTGGFTAFICWPLQPENTPTMSHMPRTDAVDYLRTVAMARIVLDNVPNLQSSWVTMGMKVGQLALTFGCNDFGSLMIEENVVSAANTTHRTTIEELERLIVDAGFTPRRRRQDYTILAAALTAGAADFATSGSGSPSVRVGIGYDSHRFAPGGPNDPRRLHDSVRRRLVGHSDGDAVAHALTDAILGAAGAGDIGEMFADTDERNRGRDSIEMLRLAVARVRALGWVVHNADITVVAERPKIGPHRGAIRAALAAAFGVDVRRRQREGQDERGNGLDRSRRGAGVHGRRVARTRERRRRKAAWRAFSPGSAITASGGALHHPGARRRHREFRPAHSRRRDRRVRKLSRRAEQSIARFQPSSPSCIGNIGGALAMFALGRRFGAEWIRRHLNRVMGDSAEQRVHALVQSVRVAGAVPQPLSSRRSRRRSAARRRDS